MIIPAILAAIATLHYIAKFVYLLFEPKFMNGKIYGAPKTKNQIAILYIAFIALMGSYVLGKLDIINFISLK